MKISAATYTCASLLLMGAVGPLPLNHPYSLFSDEGRLCEFAYKDQEEEKLGSEVNADKAWWEAIEEKNWELVERLAAKQDAPKLALLLDALEEQVRVGGRTDFPSGVPTSGGIFTLALAARWERWLLSAAYTHAAQGDALRCVIDHLASLNHSVELLRNKLLGETPSTIPKWVTIEAGKNVTQDAFSRTGQNEPVPNVVISKGVHRMLDTVTVPLGAELWVEKGAKITAKANTSLIVKGRLRVFGSSSDPVELSGRRRWGGIKFITSGGILNDVVIKNAEVGVEASKGILFVHNVLIADCSIGLDNFSGDVWCDNMMFESCTSHGALIRTNGGRWSYLSNCTFVDNHYGASLRERHRLAVWNCIFKNNKDAAIYADAGHELRAFNCNFEKAPVVLDHERSFDLTGNWWKSKARSVKYINNKKEGQAEFGDAMKERARGIGCVLPAGY